MLQVLYNRWWKQKGVSGKCDADEKKDANALEVANVGGKFKVVSYLPIFRILPKLFRFSNL